MRLFKTIPMTFKDKDYEIRVLYDEKTVNVVVFRDNHPANSLRHQLQLPNGCDVTGVLDYEIIDEMVETARGDIIENRWQMASQAIRENIAEA